MATPSRSGRAGPCSRTRTGSLSATEALLFLVGAVAAYALVGGLAFGGFSERLIPEPARAVVWGGLHFFSVGLAIAAAALVAELVSEAAAWPLGAFLATALSLLGSASQLAVANLVRRAGAHDRIASRDGG